MRIAVCEDNEIHQDVIVNMLNRYSSEHSIPLEYVPYGHGMNFLYDMDEGAYFDVVFLDIYMGDTMGNEIAHKLRAMGYKGNLIFLTASPDFAIESYDVDADGYLLKPVAYERFSKSMDKVTQGIAPNIYQIQQRNTVIKIVYHEILYIESRDSKCILHTTIPGQAYVVYKALNAIEKELEDRRFLRCHQSFLVNMDHIRQIGREFQLSSGDIIPIRKNGVKLVRQAYLDYSVFKVDENKECMKQKGAGNMTLKECYQKMGGDYAEAIVQLHNEPFIHRCILKFAKDRNYQELSDALAAGNCDAAFRAAHAFKGLCHTMVFCHLYPAVDELTECLRAGQVERATPFWESLKLEYVRTMEILQEYQKSGQN